MRLTSWRRRCGRTFWRKLRSFQRATSLLRWSPWCGVSRQARHASATPRWSPRRASTTAGRAALLAQAAKLSARDEPFALVTVVRREPPSSARVGDAALVTATGEYHGWAGGGCTREAVLRESLHAIADG